MEAEEAKGASMVIINKTRGWEERIDEEWGAPLKEASHRVPLSHRLREGKGEGKGEGNGEGDESIKVLNTVSHCILTWVAIPY